MFTPQTLIIIPFSTLLVGGVGRGGNEICEGIFAREVLFPRDFLGVQPPFWGLTLQNPTKCGPCTEPPHKAHLRPTLQELPSCI
jgi:hypothetical protein